MQVHKLILIVLMGVGIWGLTKIREASDVEAKSASPVHFQARLVAALAREVGKYHVELFVRPRSLVAEHEAQLLFRLSRDGRPVTDLQPYIGALGHCVIFSEGTQTYLHCHPEQFPLIPPSSSGPDVSFHTLFPKPHRYKIWASSSTMTK